MSGRRSATSWRHVLRDKSNVFCRHSRKWKAAGLDRHCDDVVVVVDMDGAKARWMLDVSPCLTRYRAALGFYLPARGRRMTLAERFRLQGMLLRVLRCREGISDRQLGMMVGNVLSPNVLERLLVRMLRACGLRARLKNRWQHRRRIKTTRACT